MPPHNGTMNMKDKLGCDQKSGCKERTCKARKAIATDPELQSEGGRLKTDSY